ncbi:MAG: isochorismatase family protein [Luminiphilus sp.]|nr:isochorismatase family protein [Luminiphilus sp.]MDG1460937.1 isochorismatase family protein [Luminiphilus sp.]
MGTSGVLQRNALGLGDRPALVVVDIVNGFTDPGCPLGSDADSVVAANVTLMEAFHRRGLPVFLTTVIFRDEQQARVFRNRLPALELLTPESHWVAFDTRLPIIESDIFIEKTHASSFHGTRLSEQLAEVNADSLVVTGLTTSGCVRATAVDGLQYGFRVVVPREAVGDRDLDAHNANLYDLDAKYADVISVNDAISQLP